MSLDQLVGQAAFVNVRVEKFDSFPDVFSFIDSYEDATAFLDEEKKVQLLNRAFPQGCHRSWYEMEIQPLQESSTSWELVKAKIIDRFADEDYKDRHFHRLRDLRYDPQGKGDLLDHVEQMFHCYKKAYSITTANSEALRFVKASIPREVRIVLNRDKAFREAKDERTFKDAVKIFDRYKLSERAVSPEGLHQGLKSILRQAKVSNDQIIGADRSKSLMD